MSATRRRIVATIEGPDGDIPTLDLVRGILTQRAPRGIEALSLRWSSYFRVHHRQVGRLRVGRLFIAGDAAHIHSPFGGQGMNTGLQDVWNLVWKLDLAIRSLGNEQLLDSYSQERRPVIKSAIDTTHRLTKVMGAPGRLRQALRATFIPVVSCFRAFQHRFVENLSELGIAYRGSPIIHGRGKRFFDESLRGGQGINSRFLLLLGDDAGTSTKESAKQFCESQDRLVELRLARYYRIALVRPDGYLAFAADGREPRGALESIRSLLQHQTSS